MAKCWDSLASEILPTLSNTPYACSSLERLRGGNANFLFRGVLTRPLPDGTRHVAIKHGEGYVATNPDFELPESRCVLEKECLACLSHLGATTTPACSVRTPKLYHFVAGSNTQVQEYLEQALDLKTYSLRRFAPAATDASGRSACLALGEALGSWLRSFHAWARAPGRAEFRAALGSDASMQALKHRVNYDWLVGAAAQFPSVLGDAEGVFAQVKAMALAELQDVDRLQMIHGDFWTGNVVLPDKPLATGARTPLFVVDWEMCQLGVCPMDLGQMVAELYQLFLFKGLEAGTYMVDGLTAAYGFVHDDFAFRTAVQVGTHMIACGGRVAGWGSRERVEEVVGMARDIIVKALEKDKAWFEAGDLACLFRQ